MNSGEAGSRLLLGRTRSDQALARAANVAARGDSAPVSGRSTPASSKRDRKATERVSRSTWRPPPGRGVGGLSQGRDQERDDPRRILRGPRYAKKLFMSGGHFVRARCP